MGLAEKSARLRPGRGWVWLVAAASVASAACGGGSDAGLPVHVLAVSKEGAGGGTVASTPAGIDCGSICTMSTDAASVTLLATPAAGSRLSGWSSNCRASDAQGTSCVVTLETDKSVVATFVPGDTYDVKANGIPRFIRTDYIDLDKIRRITRFRSGVGHDYSDDFEKCRTMKHYYMPSGGEPSHPWADVGIYSPVRGTVTKSFEEWAGAQIWIKSEAYPGITVIILHIALARALRVGDEVAEGERLGHHIGDQTTSDIAVGIKTPEGWKLVSYFDVMADSLFARYHERGVSGRGATVISKEERDADPLTCDGETYVGGGGQIENWVQLN